MHQEQITPPLSSHADLTRAARTALSNNWGNAVIITLIFMIISVAAGIIPFGSLIVSGPLSVGMAIFVLNLSREKYAEVGQLFVKSDKWLYAIACYVMITIFTFIGILFFIIPGIIIALGLSQTFYILADDDEIEPIDALKKSWELMDGNKWDLFLFSLRFIPWAILCLFTLGVGYLWLIPYIYVSFSKYYLELTQDDSLDTSFDALDHLIEY